MISFIHHKKLGQFRASNIASILKNNILRVTIFSIAQEIFTTLHFRDLTSLVLLTLYHKLIKLLARALFSPLFVLANLRENKVLRIKSVLQYLYKPKL